MEDKMSKVLKEVLCVTWVEPCRSTINDAGCSLHLNEEDFKAYEMEYTRNCDGDIVNFRTADAPRKAYVTPALYEQVQQADKGLRLYQLQTEQALENGSLVLGLEGKVQ
jgi:hypothetical protein